MSVYVFVVEIRNPLSVDKNKAIKQFMIYSSFVFLFPGLFQLTYIITWLSLT